MNRHLTPNSEDITDSKNKINEFLPSISTVFFLVIFILFIRFYVFSPFIVNGISMYPTFDSYHYLIVDKFTYNFLHKPERGDVIVFRFPGDPKRFFIKRIIGLPGDTVALSDYSVSINGGSPLLEPYVIDEKKKKEKPKTFPLKEGEYFVLGDNRKESADSRWWGTLPQKFIIGRAIMRLYPLNLISFKPGAYTYQQNKTVNTLSNNTQDSAINTAQ